MDLDSTIINSDKAHVVAYNKAFVKLGLKKRKSRFIISLLGRPKDDVVKALVPGKDKKFRDKINFYHDKYLVNETYRFAKRLPYVIGTLKKLRKRYRLALLSNCKHNNIIKLLKGAKVDKNLFDFIIGNDDVKHSKPWPDEILKVKKRGRIEFMIGDSIYDVMAAKRAKVKTIGVLTGYYTRKRLKRKKPDFIINSINDIFRIVKC